MGEVDASGNFRSQSECKAIADNLSKTEHALAAKRGNLGNTIHSLDQKVLEKFPKSSHNIINQLFTLSSGIKTYNKAISAVINDARKTGQLPPLITPINVGLLPQFVCDRNIVAIPMANNVLRDLLQPENDYYTAHGMKPKGYKKKKKSIPEYDGLDEMLQLIRNRLREDSLGKRTAASASRRQSRDFSRERSGQNQTSVDMQANNNNNRKQYQTGGNQQQQQEQQQQQQQYGWKDTHGTETDASQNGGKSKSANFGQPSNYQLRIPTVVVLGLPSSGKTYMYNSLFMKSGSVKTLLPVRDCVTTGSITNISFLTSREEAEYEAFRAKEKRKEKKHASQGQDPDADGKFQQVPPETISNEEYSEQIIFKLEYISGSSFSRLKSKVKKEFLSLESSLLHAGAMNLLRKSSMSKRYIYDFNKKSKKNMKKRKADSSDRTFKDKNIFNSVNVDDCYENGTQGDDDYGDSDSNNCYDDLFEGFCSEDDESSESNDLNNNKGVNNDNFKKDRDGKKIDSQMNNINNSNRNESEMNQADNDWDQLDLFENINSNIGINSTNTNNTSNNNNNNPHVTPNINNKEITGEFNSSTGEISGLGMSGIERQEMSFARKNSFIEDNVSMTSRYNPGSPNINDTSATNSSSSDGTDEIGDQRGRRGIYKMLDEFDQSEFFQGASAAELETAVNQLEELFKFVLLLKSAPEQLRNFEQGYYWGKGKEDFIALTEGEQSLLIDTMHLYTRSPVLRLMTLCDLPGLEQEVNNPCQFIRAEIRKERLIRALTMADGTIVVSFHSELGALSRLFSSLRLVVDQALWSYTFSKPLILVYTGVDALDPEDAWSTIQESKQTALAALLKYIPTMDNAPPFVVTSCRTYVRFLQKFLDSSSCNDSTINPSNVGQNSGVDISLDDFEYDFVGEEEKERIKAQQQAMAKWNEEELFSLHHRRLGVIQSIERMIKLLTTKWPNIDVGLLDYQKAVDAELVKTICGISSLERCLIALWYNIILSELENIISHIEEILYLNQSNILRAQLDSAFHYELYTSKIKVSQVIEFLGRLSREYLKINGPEPMTNTMQLAKNMNMNFQQINVADLTTDDITNNIYLKDSLPCRFNVVFGDITKIFKAFKVRVMERIKEVLNVLRTKYISVRGRHPGSISDATLFKQYYNESLRVVNAILSNEKDPAYILQTILNNLYKIEDTTNTNVIGVIENSFYIYSQTPFNVFKRNVALDYTDVRLYEAVCEAVSGNSSAVVYSEKNVPIFSVTPVTTTNIGGDNSKLRKFVGKVKASFAVNKKKRIFKRCLEQTANDLYTQSGNLLSELNNSVYEILNTGRNHLLLITTKLLSYTKRLSQLSEKYNIFKNEENQSQSIDYNYPERMLRQLDSDKERLPLSFSLSPSSENPQKALAFRMEFLSKTLNKVGSYSLDLVSFLSGFRSDYNSSVKYVEPMIKSIDVDEDPLSLLADSFQFAYTHLPKHLREATYYEMNERRQGLSNNSNNNGYTNEHEQTGAHTDGNNNSNSGSSIQTDPRRHSLQGISLHFLSLPLNIESSFYAAETNDIFNLSLSTNTGIGILVQRERSPATLPTTYSKMPEEEQRHKSKSTKKRDEAQTPKNDALSRSSSRSSSEESQEEQSCNRRHKRDNNRKEKKPLIKFIDEENESSSDSNNSNNNSNNSEDIEEESNAIVTGLASSSKRSSNRSYRNRQREQHNASSSVSYSSSTAEASESYNLSKYNNTDATEKSQTSDDTNERTQDTSRNRVVQTPQTKTRCRVSSEEDSVDDYTFDIYHPIIYPVVNQDESAFKIYPKFNNPYHLFPTSLNLNSISGFNLVYKDLRKLKNVIYGPPSRKSTESTQTTMSCDYRNTVTLYMKPNRECVFTLSAPAKSMPFIHTFTYMTLNVQLLSDTSFLDSSASKVVKSRLNRELGPETLSFSDTSKHFVFEQQHNGIKVNLNTTLNSLTITSPIYPTINSLETHVQKGSTVNASQPLNTTSTSTSTMAKKSAHKSEHSEELHSTNASPPNSIGAKPEAVPPEDTQRKQQQQQQQQQPVSTNTSDTPAELLSEAKTVTFSSSLIITKEVKNKLKLLKLLEYQHKSLEGDVSTSNQDFIYRGQLSILFTSAVDCAIHQINLPTLLYLKRYKEFSNTRIANDSKCSAHTTLSTQDMKRSKQGVTLLPRKIKRLVLKPVRFPLVGVSYYYHRILSKNNYCILKYLTVLIIKELYGSKSMRRGSHCDVYDVGVHKSKVISAINSSKRSSINLEALHEFRNVQQQLRDSDSKSTSTKERLKTVDRKIPRSKLITNLVWNLLNNNFDMNNLSALYLESHDQLDVRDDSSITNTSAGDKTSDSNTSCTNTTNTDTLEPKTRSWKAGRIDLEKLLELVETVQCEDQPNITSNRGKLTDDERMVAICILKLLREGFFPLNDPLSKEVINEDCFAIYPNMSAVVDAVINRKRPYISSEVSPVGNTHQKISERDNSTGETHNSVIRLSISLFIFILVLVDKKVAIFTCENKIINSITSLKCGESDVNRIESISEEEGNNEGISVTPSTLISLLIPSIKDYVLILIIIITNLMVEHKELEMLLKYETTTTIKPKRPRNFLSPEAVHSRSVPSKYEQLMQLHSLEEIKYKFVKSCVSAMVVNTSLYREWTRDNTTKEPPIINLLTNAILIEYCGKDFWKELNSPSANNIDSIRAERWKRIDLDSRNILEEVKGMIQSDSLELNKLDLKVLSGNANECEETNNTYSTRDTERNVVSKPLPSFLSPEIEQQLLSNKSNTSGTTTSNTLTDVDKRYGFSGESLDILYKHYNIPNKFVRFTQNCKVMGLINSIMDSERRMLDDSACRPTLGADKLIESISEVYDEAANVFKHREQLPTLDYAKIYIFILVTALRMFAAYFERHFKAERFDSLWQRMLVRCEQKCRDLVHLVNATDEETPFDAMIEIFMGFTKSVDTAGRTWAYGM